MFSLAKLENQIPILEIEMLLKDFEIFCA